MTWPPDDGAEKKEVSVNDVVDHYLLQAAFSTTYAANCYALGLWQCSVGVCVKDCHCGCESMGLDRREDVSPSESRQKLTAMRHETATKTWPRKSHAKQPRKEAKTPTRRRSTTQQSHAEKKTQETQEKQRKMQNDDREMQNDCKWAGKRTPGLLLQRGWRLFTCLCPGAHSRPRPQQGRSAAGTDTLHNDKSPWKCIPAPLQVRH